MDDQVEVNTTEVQPSTPTHTNPHTARPNLKRLPQMQHLLSDLTMPHHRGSTQRTRCKGKCYRRDFCPLPLPPPLALMLLLLHKRVIAATANPTVRTSLHKAQPALLANDPSSNRRPVRQHMGPELWSASPPSCFSRGKSTSWLNLHQPLSSRHTCNMAEKEMKHQQNRETNLLPFELPSERPPLLPPEAPALETDDFEPSGRFPDPAVE